MSADLRSAADVVASARRSLVGVRSGASCGTGWAVLGNGLLMTSHEAVGYEPAVRLVLEGGKRSEGRVIWVDVARDLALVLPAEQLSLPPLLARPDLPRLGEPVLAPSAAPDGPWRVVSGIVGAIDVRLGPLRCFEVDAPVTSRGGPILDLDGRVIGVGGLDLPRGGRRRAGAEQAALRSTAIPISALTRALAAVDIAPHQFEGKTPTYRCPACNESFHPRDERCRACGRGLPHAWEARAPAASAALAERLLLDWMAELGVAPGAGRTGPRSFRLGVRGGLGAAVTITFEVDEGGAAVRAKIPLMPVPGANQEPFYRFLLTLNDQTLGAQRFSIEDDTVFLSLVEPASLVGPGEAPVRVQELVRESERYQKALTEAFELPAAD